MRCPQLTCYNCAVIVWVAARRLEEVGDGMRLGNSEVREQEREKKFLPNEGIAQWSWVPNPLGAFSSKLDGL